MANLVGVFNPGKKPLFDNDFRLYRPQILVGSSGGSVGAKHSCTKFTLEPINYRRECFAPTCISQTPTRLVLRGVGGICFLGALEKSIRYFARIVYIVYDDLAKFIMLFRGLICFEKI
jgi:hypothetical protein